MCLLFNVFIFIILSVESFQETDDGNDGHYKLFQQ